MSTIAPGSVRKPNRRPGAIPAPVPLVTPADRAYYDRLLEVAAAVEGLFPLTPGEYAEAAGVSAVLEAQPLWIA